MTCPTLDRPQVRSRFVGCVDDPVSPAARRMRRFTLPASSPGRGRTSGDGRGPRTWHRSAGPGRGRRPRHRRPATPRRIPVRLRARPPLGAGAGHRSRGSRQTPKRWRASPRPSRGRRCDSRTDDVRRIGGGFGSAVGSLAEAARLRVRTLPHCNPGSGCRRCGGPGGDGAAGQGEGAGAPPCRLSAWRTRR